MDSRQSRAWTVGSQAGYQDAQTLTTGVRHAPRRSTEPDGQQAIQTSLQGQSHPYNLPRRPHDISPIARGAALDFPKGHGSAQSPMDPSNSELRPPSFTSEQASPSSPKSANPMLSASRMSSNGSGHANAWERKTTERQTGSSEGRFVSLAVPYANTSPSTRPTLGDRPLQANSAINGVPKHTRTYTPMPEVTPMKSGKRTLNLLNPVNLLMRRRSGIPQTGPGDTSHSKGLMVPPMALPADYDPRIRGKVIHDFSAPRVRRELSQHNLPTGQVRVAHPGEDSRKDDGLRDSAVEGLPQNPANQKRISQHSAVFKEHLEDTSNDDRQASAVHAESLANQDFLKRLSQHHAEYDPSNLPLFTPSNQQRDFQQFRKSIGDWQARISDPSSASSKSEQSPASDSVAEQGHSRYSGISSDPDSRERSSNPLNLEKTSVAASTSPPQFNKGGATELPKHVKSNASRFSFQLTGYENVVEEKLLEERAKRQRAAIVAQRQIIPDEDEDYFDEDAMYDADELEGRDDEMNEFEGLGQYTMADSPIGPASINLDTLPNHTPQRDAFTIQPNANIQKLLEWQRAQARSNSGLDQSVVATNLEQSAPFDILGSGQRSDSHHGLREQLLSLKSNVEEEQRSFRASHEFDDDFYFNDGTLGVEADTFDDLHIDEDDLFGSGDEAEQIKKGRAFAAVATVPVPEPSPSGYCIGAGELGEQIIAAQMRQQYNSAIGLQHSVAAPIPTASTDLAAYHNALAEAAHQAAADGRFSRAASNATTASKYSQRSISSQLTSRADGRNLASPSKQPTQRVPNGARDSYSGFDFGFNSAATASTTTPLSASFPANAMTVGEEDMFLGDNLGDFDGLDDEDIISEANAEALASDDEGFYGREFGFYARARPGSGDVEYVNGGFFGAPGGSTIERKYSVKEPNLTPITERSEFSTRNSLIGGPFTPAMSTPAFASQLARMSPLALAHMHEDDMTLEQMLKLRNLAFAGTDGTGRSGSISSMSSAAGYSSGRPLSHRGSWAVTAAGAQSPAKSGSPMGMHQSTDSGRSSVRMSRSQSELLHGEHFATQSPITDSPISSQSARVYPWHSMGADPDSTPRKPMPADSPQAPQTAIKSGQKQTRNGHGRSSSGGGDSVTYTKERDDDGRERWILERRRTSEAGLVELIGREIVQGGRI